MSRPTTLKLKALPARPAPGGRREKVNWAGMSFHQCARNREMLTASLENIPDAHDGENAFTFELRFSEEFSLSYRTLRDHAFTVAGGVICTRDGRMLSNELVSTVGGPEGEAPPGRGVRTGEPAGHVLERTGAPGLWKRRRPPSPPSRGRPDQGLHSPPEAAQPGTGPGPPWNPRDSLENQGRVPGVPIWYADGPAPPCGQSIAGRAPESKPLGATPTQAERGVKMQENQTTQETTQVALYARVSGQDERSI